MTYFMQFDSSMKAIRPTANTRLRMPTARGDVEVHIYATKFRQIGPSLVAVPLTDDNVRVLGLDPEAHTTTSRWIIPPFPLLNTAFTKGGPFIRDGKLSDDWPGFNIEHTAVGPDKYRPGLPGFVPEELDYPLDVTKVDTTDWTIEMWTGGAGVRQAEPEERDYLLIPWTFFSVGHMDLWLEQYRCFHLGLEIPTELSPPDEDIDGQRDECTTDAGMRTSVIRLDESAGDDAGKDTMYAKVLVDSRLDKAVTKAGGDASGYFLDAVLRYWQAINTIAAGVELDPEGDGVGVTGQPDEVAVVREKLNGLPADAAQLGVLIADVESAGISID